MIRTKGMCAATELREMSSTYSVKFLVKDNSFAMCILDVTKFLDIPMVAYFVH